MAVQIDDDRAVGATLPHRPIIDSDMAGWQSFGHRHGLDQTQHCGGAGRHAQRGEETGATLAAAGDADTALNLGEPSRASSMRLDQPRPSFSEGASSTRRIGAVEPPHLDAEAGPRCGARQIGRRSTVAAMNRSARAVAVGTSHVRRLTKHLDHEPIRAFLRQTLDGAARQRKRNVHTLYDGKATEVDHRSESIRRDPPKVRKSQQVTPIAWFSDWAREGVWIADRPHPQRNRPTRQTTCRRL